VSSPTAKPSAAASVAASAAASAKPAASAAASAQPAASAAASGAAAAKPAAGKEIVISGSMALTGNFADVGKNYLKTYQWYFDNLNKSGGLLGRPVKLVINDDESNPQKAAQLYDKYISVDKSDLLIGPYPTPILAAVIPVVEREKMVLVQAGTAAASLLLGKNNKYTFTAFTFLDRDYAKGWTDWIKTLPADQRPKTLAILTLNNPFTIGVQKGLADLAKDAGMNVAVNEVYDGNTSDFTPLVQKAKAANADAVALLSYYPDSVQITKTMSEQKLKPKTWYNAISSTVPTWTKDLGALGDNTVSPAQTWATLKTGKGVQDALQFGKDEFKIDYIPLHVGASMTVSQILTAGVQGCGKIDQDCIADWLRKNSIDTVAGKIKFDKDQFPEYWSILTQVQNGKLFAVSPSEVADGKMVYPQP
jgi:branched-chain amino acid transport system substrate-binding protein